MKLFLSSPAFLKSFPGFPIILIMTLGMLCSCKAQVSKLEQLAAQNKHFDYFLKNARIIDGTGAPAYSADLLLRADSIAYIGKVDATLISVERSIDLTGLILTPGFIDPHAHGNPVRRPAFQNFLAQGVTSISLGQDGRHGPFKDVNFWVKKINEAKPGVNILPFVGHASLRELSGIGYDTRPSESQLEEMISLLEDALRKGLWGLSTGLEYRPGFMAKERELELLAKQVGKYDRMIMSHVRNEDDDVLENSLRELIQQGTFCRVHVAHMKSVYGKGANRAEELLGLLDSARQNGVNITADVYPYTASYTGISILFPDWALPPNDYAKVKGQRKDELEEYLKNRVNKRNGPQATLLGSGPYARKTLEVLSKEMNKPYEKILVEDIGPGGASAAYFIMDEALQNRLLQDPHVMVSSDGSPTMWHPRGYGSFAKIIETHTLTHKLFSLEEAIHKMTGLTAETLQVPDRGRVEVGYSADLVAFDPDSVSVRASFESPHELAEGISFVWVNGMLVKEGPVLSDLRNGKVLLLPTQP